MLAISVLLNLGGTVIIRREIKSGWLGGSIVRSNAACIALWWLLIIILKPKRCLKKYRLKYRLSSSHSILRAKFCAGLTRR